MWFPAVLFVTKLIEIECQSNNVPNSSSHYYLPQHKSLWANNYHYHRNIATTYDYYYLNNFLKSSTNIKLQPKSRPKRESSALISTFDISKIFIKNKVSKDKTKPLDAVLEPSMSPLKNDGRKYENKYSVTTAYVLDKSVLTSNDSQTFTELTVSVNNKNSTVQEKLNKNNTTKKVNRKHQNIRNNFAKSNKDRRNRKMKPNRNREIKLGRGNKKLNKSNRDRRKPNVTKELTTLESETLNIFSQNISTTSVTRIHDEIQVYETTAITMKNTSNINKTKSIIPKTASTYSQSNKQTTLDDKITKTFLNRFVNKEKILETTAMTLPKTLHLNKNKTVDLAEINTESVKATLANKVREKASQKTSLNETQQQVQFTTQSEALQTNATFKTEEKRPKSRITKSSLSPLSLVSGKREPRVVLKKKTESLMQWPVKHAAVVEGDIVLGGLMMVHSRSEVWTCGPVMPQGGAQALEAALFALDSAKDLLSPTALTVGAHILDDCDNDTYGLEMALDFIKGSISNIDDAEYSCNASAVRKVISGVVGAASSVTSVQVANLLRLFKIPQVSFFSTSPELSNKARFEYFTRTIPSDLHQVRAMVEIVRQLHWTYVSIIYEESNYGIKAFEELETLLARNNICIAVKERLAKDSGEADERAYDDIVAHLLTKPRARGVIIFGSDQEVAGVMAAVTRARATDAFRWVGSDGWSARSLVSDGNEEAVEGTISVQPQANEVKGFKEYFLNLTVENNKRNPWFVEFWEDHFRCRYPGSPLTPYNGNYTRCSGAERLTADNTEFEAQLQFVADAVLAFIYAIKDMHADLCEGRAGLCEAMKPTSGATLLKYLREVQFVGLSGDEFHFDHNGDGPARYNILHFKQLTPGVYRWIKVGQYLDGLLDLDMSLVRLQRGSDVSEDATVDEDVGGVGGVVSACSASCGLGQARQYAAGESCCWTCYNCSHYEIVLGDQAACWECPLGTAPSPSRSTCVPLADEFVRADSPAALGAVACAALGLLLTTLVGGVWVARRGSALVRASGAGLCLVALAGLASCHLVTIALLLRPTDLLCTVQRFGTGLCFTIVYAALLTKTNRIFRIFNASKHSAKRPSLISPKSQLVICGFLIFIQVVIVSAWQALSPARAERLVPPRAPPPAPPALLVCSGARADAVLVAYPAALLAACTLYAVRARKIPEAFNESKHIGFTMYTTCVIWLAFVPLYFGTASHVPLRVTSMAVTISLSASVTLICLFSPKLYIILVHPERNVRASLMPSRRFGTREGARRPPPLPPAPPDPTPSTERSTLHDNEKIVQDKNIQTEDSHVDDGEESPSKTSEDPLPLNPNKLLSIKAGLPNFEVLEKDVKGKMNGAPDITIIGTEISL